ncbi:MAG: hypothetical protein CR993_03875 [Rhodobacterales bacterium]|nr:MAG: hypothetical protein CR993_03875 [Rhodobacterales bacterium]
MYLARKLALGIGLFGGAALAEEARPPEFAAQWETYLQSEVANVIEFAPMREVQEAALPDGRQVRLTALHPGVNRWYLLEIEDEKGRVRSYHLENADADYWRYSLSDEALVISAGLQRYSCRPWAAQDGPSELEKAAQTGLPYAPICEDRAYLRNRVSGSRTNREAVSDFLRENVFFGDKLVNLIKGTFFEDAFLETGEEAEGLEAGEMVAALGVANLSRRPVLRTGMGLPVEGAEGGMEAGGWYAVTDAQGVYASVVRPGLIAEEILSARDGANWLDGTERNADVYLVGFDLSRFDIGYELGTDHPGLGWSSRPPRRSGEWNLPGPDGFNRPAPLVLNGMLSPALTHRAVAAFAGGFKRDHGAWRFGPMAGIERGHHYGFLSNGVTFSRLRPSLATLTVSLDGEVSMGSWSEERVNEIPNLAYARQNGVPLVERDPETGAVVPGKLVSSWGPGNWSGSAEAQLRTLRSGACIREVSGRKFLIYGYFSSVTPSAMARVFQAYACDYGMLLDMNSPELTYMALFRHDEETGRLTANHLSNYMEGSDPWVGDGRVPRFVGFSDNRDFFYLLRKE